MKNQTKTFQKLHQGIFIASVVAVSAVIGGILFAGNASAAKASARIVGGQLAINNEFSFMVALLDTSIQNNSQAQFCGGSLIAPDWVLTAAHCVQDTDADDIDVLVHTNELDGSGTRIRAVKIIAHPDYAISEKSDVALIKLSNNANSAAIPMLKSATGLDSSGHLATVIGWGLTSDQGFPSNRLLKVDVPIVSNSVCNSAYSGQIDTNNEICAGFPQGGKDSCSGDSGGPLFVKDDNGILFQAGIVSWGDGCAVAGKYGVYARVSSHINWIEQIINDSPVIDPSVITEPAVIEGGLNISFSHQCTGLVCQFTAEIEGNNSGVDEYLWDFGDFISWEFGQNVGYTYEGAGSYEVFVVAITRDGEYIEASKVITVTGSGNNNVFELGDLMLETQQHYISNSAALEFGTELDVEMTGPENADYDLYLEKFNSSTRAWVKVAGKATPKNNEKLIKRIMQDAEYRLKVVAYRGRGKFGLTIEVK